MATSTATIVTSSSSSKVSDSLGNQENQPVSYSFPRRKFGLLFSTFMEQTMVIDPL